MSLIVLRRIWSARIFANCLHWQSLNRIYICLRCARFVQKYAHCARMFAVNCIKPIFKPVPRPVLNVPKNAKHSWQIVRVICQYLQRLPCQHNDFFDTFKGDGVLTYRPCDCKRTSLLLLKRFLWALSVTLLTKKDVV